VFKLDLYFNNKQLCSEINRAVMNENMIVLLN